MAKRDLDQTWIYNGKFYGPGTGVELPDDAAEAIDGKMGRTPDEGAHETVEPDDQAGLGTIVHGTLEERPDDADPGVQIGPADLPPARSSRPIQRGKR